MQLKICSKCGKEKEISEFHNNLGGIFGVRGDCKVCEKQYKHKYNQSESAKISVKNYHSNNPWISRLNQIKQRCNNINNEFYYCYGGRGIKCKITSEELKELWFRDKAYLMDEPYIDRIDNDGDYTFDNCQYLELIDNVIKSHQERKIRK